MLTGPADSSQGGLALEDTDSPRESQRELQPGVVEPAVHPELRDATAVDEAAAADVERLGLLVGEGVENVAPSHGEAYATAQLAAEIEIEERFGPERLVVVWTAHLMEGDRAVVRRPRQAAESPPGVPRGDAPLPARQ